MLCEVRPTARGTGWFKYSDKSGKDEIGASIEHEGDGVQKSHKRRRRNTQLRGTHKRCGFWMRLI